MKRLDLSVLPDGFLIEVPTRTALGADIWSIRRMNSLSRTYAGFGEYRPALDIDHFNNGKMVLPDGLVVECKYAFSDHERTDYISTRDTLDIEKTKFSIKDGKPDISWLNLHYNADDDCNNKIIAVKILGVTEEYREHGEQLGMAVVEL